MGMNIRLQELTGVNLNELNQSQATGINLNSRGVGNWNNLCTVP